MSAWGRSTRLPVDVSETAGDVVRRALRDERRLDPSSWIAAAVTGPTAATLAPARAAQALRHRRDAVDAREHDPVVARHRVDRVLERAALGGPDLDEGTIVTSAPRRSSSSARDFDSGRVTTIRTP
jgi:hypothetical protein